MLPLAHGHPPLAGVSYIGLRLRQGLDRVLRRIIGQLDLHEVIQVEIIDVALPDGHALALPALDGGFPGAVDDGDAVGILVGKHALEAFVRGHGFHVLISIIQTGFTG